ncbi:MAG: hypothetical protein WAM24_00030, partial [Ignavibacteriaceae bacterium]
MKTSFKLLLYFLLLSGIIFPQNRISVRVRRNFKEFKSNSIKSARSNWKEALRDKQFNGNNIDDKKVIYKKLLENGFLLVEETYKIWIDSVWVNQLNDLYTYDGKGNLT